MKLSPKDIKFLVTGGASALMTLSEVASQAGAFEALGVWGQLLVKAIFLCGGLVIGWMNLRTPESMRPPPIAQVPNGKDVRRGS